MDKDIQKNRAFGLKIVSFSPFMTLILAAVLAFILIFINFRLLFIASMFFLGVVLSPLLVMQYKTGNQIYAMVYGGAFGLCFFIVAIISSPPAASIEIIVLSGLHGALWSLFGISLIFSVLRKKLIRFIKGEDR